MDEDASADEIRFVVGILWGVELEVESEGLARTDPVRGSVELADHEEQRPAVIATGAGGPSPHDAVRILLRLQEVLPDAGFLVGSDIEVMVEGGDSAISEAARTIADDSVLREVEGIRVGSSVDDTEDVRDILTDGAAGWTP